MSSFSSGSRAACADQAVANNVDTLQQRLAQQSVDTVTQLTCTTRGPEIGRAETIAAWDGPHQSPSRCCFPRLDHVSRRQGNENEVAK